MWFVGAVALAVRLVLALGLDGLQRPDLQEWDTIARNMLAGRGFTYLHHGVVYHSYIAPLSAWIAAASYWVSGSIVPAMLLQVAAGTAGAVVAALLARRLWGGRVAPLAAGLLVACHPGLAVYAAAKSHSQVFDALFFSLALLQAFRMADRPTTWRGLQLGVIIGVGILSRPTIIIFLPLVTAWLCWATPRVQRTGVVRGMAVASVCAAALVAPWAVRNTLIHDRFVFILTTDSEVFWRGNNPMASGNAYVTRGLTVFDALPPEERQDLEQQPGELAQADWFATRARAHVRTNPAAFARLTAVKFAQFWTFSANTGLLYPRAWLWLYAIYYATLCALAVVGTVRLVRAGGTPLARAGLLGAFLLALSGLQSLYYVEGRHRWGVEPMMIVLSGGGVAALVRTPREARLL